MKETKTRFFAMPVLLTVLIMVLTALFPVRSQQLNSKQSDANELNAQDNGGAGKSTGLVSLKPGQSVRVAAVNVGNKIITGQLYFVPINEQGKAGIAISCDMIPAPGDAAFETYTHPGGVNRILLYAQVRVRQNPNDIKDLVPSLEVFDTQTGRTEFVLSGADFVSFRPIFNPPRPAPET